MATCTFYGTTKKAAIGKSLRLEGRRAKRAFFVIERALHRVAGEPRHRKSKSIQGVDQLQTLFSGERHQWGPHGGPRVVAREMGNHGFERGDHRELLKRGAYGVERSLA